LSWRPIILGLLIHVKTAWWIRMSVKADPDLNPAFNLNADPDPSSQTNADPDPGQTFTSQKVEL
jgi:hypothetical protein